MRHRSDETGSPVHRFLLPVLLAAVAGPALLTSCTDSGGSEPTASPDSPAAVDTDSVQTDAPVETAAVVLTYAEFSAASRRIEAAAHVQGLLETGGTCTVTATRDGAAALVGTGQAAEPGAATLECGALDVAVPPGGSGVYEVSVTYSSATTELSSPTIEVKVP